MSKGQKHLIKCRCVLPQFKKLENPLVHKFVLFSIIQDDESVILKYAQCNKCGVIHRVTDICKSDIISGKDNMNSLIKIDDIRASLHQNFIGILEASSSDIATWEAVQYIVENKNWGDFVILTTEIENNETHGKYIRILG